MKVVRFWLVIVLWGVGLGGMACKSAASQEEITVSAAASLREAFEKLGQDFEASRPGVKVVFNFAGSQSLRMQIEQGARVNVYASADPGHLEALVESGHVTVGYPLAENSLVLAVSSKSAGVERFEDLVHVERLVLGGPEVPVGRYSQEVIARADAALGNGFADKVRARVVSRENNVRLVLAKVVLGEADAALVYRTDAIAAGAGVKIVEIPQAYQVVAMYSIGVVGRDNRARAQEFVDFVRSEQGAARLSAYGFQSLRVLPASREAR